MPKFVKYDNFWYEYDGSTPLDHATLYNIVVGKLTNEDIRGYNIIELKSNADLDWKGTSIYNDKYMCGWLSPSGKFYGCDYTEHNLQALIVHRVREWELEQKGFIKISYEDKTLQRLEAQISINRLTKKWNNITRQQYEFLKSYPINNFSSIDYIYRQQVHSETEEHLDL